METQFYRRLMYKITATYLWSSIQNYKISSLDFDTGFGFSNLITKLDNTRFTSAIIQSELNYLKYVLQYSTKHYQWWIQDLTYGGGGEICQREGGQR